MSKGLYIHIPFCVKKCNYCDFLSAPASKETKEAYVAELIEEIKYKSFAFENIYDEDSNDVDTIFIGGGTPSILSGKSIKKIMNSAKFFKFFIVCRLKSHTDSIDASIFPEFKLFFNSFLIFKIT